MFVYTKIPCIVFRVAPGSSYLPSVERSLRVRLARKLLVLFYFLKLYREAGMNIDARLSIIPTAAAAVHKAARFCTTIIGILGIEDIIDLTHEADIGPLAIGYWRLAIGDWQ